MNRKQRTVILAGVAIIALMLIVPPWSGRSSIAIGSPTAVTRTISAGYAPIFKPPYPSAFIDITRLFVQCLIVVVLSGGIAFALQPKRESS